MHPPWTLKGGRYTLESRQSVPGPLGSMKTHMFPGKCNVENSFRKNPLSLNREQRAFSYLPLDPKVKDGARPLFETLAPKYFSVLRLKIFFSHAVFR